MIKIAIIGAGLSGLSAAHLLKNHAHITVFEKARGVSGRMSTRRAEPYFFDHGAQYFTARTSAFKAFIQPLIDQEIIQPWHANYVKIDGNTIQTSPDCGNDELRYVGSPSMSMVTKHLAEDLTVHLNTRITDITRKETWCLQDENDQRYEGFDWVIITSPAPQTADLLPETFRYYDEVKAVKMQACFSLMLGFSQPLALEFETAHITNADISWLSVNSKKPNRIGQYSLLVHSCADYAERHIDEDRNDVMQHLIAETSRVVGHDVSTADYKAIHGWRYANNVAVNKVTANNATANNQPLLLDQALQLAVCGDWCVGGRVEGAFTSAYQLADAMKQHLI